MVQKSTNVQRVEMDSERQAQLITELSGHIRRWGLVVPGIVFLEANKPFGFLGSQLILFAQPFLDLFISPATTAELAALFEERNSIDRLIQRLETDAGDVT